MKKLLYMASILALTFTSCDPMEDVYDEVDKANAQELADKKFYSDKTLIEDGYRLVDADFELSSNDDVKNYKSFSEYQTAADYLPEILTNKMLFGEAGVEYKIWFDYYRGKSDELSNYRSEHEVSTEEYDGLGGAIKELGFFTSNNSAATNLPALLAAAHADAEEGDVFKTIALEASKSIDAAKYLEMGEDEYKVILDVVKADDAKKHLVEAKYGTSEYYYGSNSYSKNFDARTYKWAAYDDYSTMSEDDLEDLIYDRMVEGLIVLLKNQYPDATILDAGGNEITYVVKYAVYDGDQTKTKYLRFKCIAEGASLDFERVGSMYVNTKQEFYMFDGTDWNVEDEVYRLENEDYDGMGTDYGFPGKYNNFDASMDPNHYLPTFMNNKWAYAQDNEARLVIYKFYNSGVTEVRVDEYTFNKDTKWQLTATTVDGSAIVAFKDKTWVYVPPIKLIKTDKAATQTHTLTDADYELVGNGRYGNFDTRDGKDEADEAVIIEKLTKILKANYSLKVGDVYEVTYKYYDGSTKTGTMKLEAVADN